jgi:hypothetical protein
MADAREKTEKKSNTTASLTNAQLSLETKKISAKFKEEKKVKVSVPKAFQKQLGPSLFVGINGSSLYIPVDGEDHEVPESFAKHVKKYIKDLK